MRKIIAFVCVTSVLAVACSGAVAKLNDRTDEPILGNAGLMFSIDELRLLEEKAMGGSAEAASRLGAHYSVMAVNDTEAWRWYAIGAENGDSGCMYSLWTIGRQSEDRLLRIRGEYWLERAASLGNERALRALESGRNGK